VSCATLVSGCGAPDGPEAETVSDWSQGVPLAYIRELCGYWADGYDWRATERRLNALPQFRTEIDGLGIHFVHVRSPHPDALPLILTHGWPGSIVEFLKVIGPLADPTTHGGDAADAFHVLCPSLPGDGFSDKPARRGWGLERIARAWTRLMQRLGYRRYGAQGGDWGTSISTVVGQLDPEHVAGIHLTPPLAPPDPATFDDLTEAERAALAALAHAAEWESGYSKEHATRPQTIGYSLVDSPAGLCAWIVEKFWAWTDTSTVGLPRSPTQLLCRDVYMVHAHTGLSRPRCHTARVRRFGRRPWSTLLPATATLTRTRLGPPPRRLLPPVTQPVLAARSRLVGRLRDRPALHAGCRVGGPRAGPGGRPAP
jgi:pimeloyl-ACP methyl ester carboxylesterase